MILVKNPISNIEKQVIMKTVQILNGRPLPRNMQEAVDMGFTKEECVLLMEQNLLARKLKERRTKVDFFRKVNGI